MKELSILLLAVPTPAFSADDNSFYLYSTDGSTHSAVHFAATDSISRKTGQLPAGLVDRVEVSVNATLRADAKVEAP